MIQIRARSRTRGAQVLAMAVSVAALLTLTAIGIYEIGVSRAQSHSLVVQPSTVQPLVSTTPAPPMTGLQP